MTLGANALGEDYSRASAWRKHFEKEAWTAPIREKFTAAEIFAARREKRLEELARQAFDEAKKLQENTQYIKIFAKSWLLTMVDRGQLHPNYNDLIHYVDALPEKAP